MNDLISRQAAIDYFVTNVGFHDEDGYPIEDECELREIWTGYFDGIQSAQPKRGKWIKKHRHYGGFRSYTGFDVMGEQHTVTVDERSEYDDLYCSECGARSADNFLNFCPNCGSYNGGEYEV